jgi:hypothetical protein
MELEQILENVESRLIRAGRAIWKPDSKAEVREEAERLAAELSERHGALEKARGELSGAHRRLNENQNAARVLTHHIQACLSCGHGDQAWQFALQLDKLRQEISADTARLPGLEQISWSIQFQIRQMERQLARLQQKC